MPNVGDEIKNSDITNLRTKLNALAIKYSLTGLSVPVTSEYGNMVKSEHIDALKTRLVQINASTSNSNRSINLNLITEYSRGDLIKAKLFNDIDAIINSISTGFCGCHAYVPPCSHSSGGGGCSCTSDKCSCDSDCNSNSRGCSCHNCSCYGKSCGSDCSCYNQCST